MKIIKQHILLFFALGISASSIAQITLIPDPGFELFLVNEGIDTDGMVNGQVLTSDISDETELTFFYPPITDLTGIEDFASLEYLSIIGMDIIEINLSQNSNLWILNIQDVSLENLNLGNNQNLFQFNISLNSNSGLYTANLSELDLSMNLLLDTFTINGTFLTTLDLSNNVNLTHLEIRQMDDLVSVNLKNGTNTTLDYLEIKFNPQLACIQVDDPSAVIAGVDPPYDNWTISDDPIITDDCQLGVSDFLNDEISVYPNPINDLLFIESNPNIHIQSIKIYDLLGDLVLIKTEDFRHTDVSALKSGVYFLKLNTERGNLTKKVIKI